MDETSPRLVYNPDDGSVMLQVGDPAVTVDGIIGEVEFERNSAEGERMLALWLDPAQADVLAKMIDHIIENVRIRAESKQTLTELLPQVQAIVERHQRG